MVLSRSLAGTVTLFDRSTKMRLPEENTFYIFYMQDTWVRLHCLTGRQRCAFQKRTHSIYSICRIPGYGYIVWQVDKDAPSRREHILYILYAGYLGTVTFFDRSTKMRLPEENTFYIFYMQDIWGRLHSLTGRPRCAFQKRTHSIYSICRIPGDGYILWQVDKDAPSIREHILYILYAGYLGTVTFFDRSTKMRLP
jgi:hypothetical protein